MSDDAPRWASFSSAFSIVLSLASDRIAELGCAPVGEDPKAFVDRGGLPRLETEAADAAIRRAREAAYLLIFRSFGSEMPRGKGRKLVLTRLGQDLRRIERPWDIKDPLGKMCASRSPKACVVTGDGSAAFAACALAVGRPNLTIPTRTLFMPQAG
jgi:hypothetical protein